eukprot:12903889-Prorocentrum_lima.AAC.1
MACNQHRRAPTDTSTSVAAMTWKQTPRKVTGHPQKRSTMLVMVCRQRPRPPTNASIAMVAIAASST